MSLNHRSVTGTQQQNKMEHGGNFELVTGEVEGESGGVEPCTCIKLLTLPNTFFSINVVEVHGD